MEFLEILTKLPFSTHTRIFTSYFNEIFQLAEHFEAFFSDKKKIHNFSCQIKVVKSFLAYNRNNFTIFCLIKNSHFSRDFGLKYKNPNWRFSKFFHQLEFFSQSSWMELAGGIPARFFFVLLRLIPDKNQFVLEFQNARLVVFFAADALFLRTKSYSFFKQRWSSLY